MMTANETTKCLIIGSGPAGYTAAIYASRANLSPILYEGIQPGGQLTTTTEIENFPGYPEGTTGTEMMEDLKKQALRFQADVRFGIATEVQFNPHGNHFVTIDGKHVIEAQTVIIATGASAKYLGLPDETKYAGQGVSACATCDGFFYRKKTVAVVGGGDTACEEAIYLSHLAAKVYLLVRKDHFRASKIMQERVLSSENIEVMFETQATGLFGENGVEGMHVVKHQGTDQEETLDIAIDGFFLAIGHQPNTRIFASFLELDDHGYIITNGVSTHTNVPGVFAAGDVADTRYRQAITAAGSGCKAAMDAERYIVDCIR